MFKLPLPATVCNGQTHGSPVSNSNVRVTLQISNKWGNAEFGVQCRGHGSVNRQPIDVLVLRVALQLSSREQRHSRAGQTANGTAPQL